MGISILNMLSLKVKRLLGVFLGHIYIINEKKSDLSDFKKEKCFIWFKTSDVVLSHVSFPKSFTVALNLKSQNISTIHTERPMQMKDFCFV